MRLLGVATLSSLLSIALGRRISVTLDSIDSTYAVDGTSLQDVTEISVQASADVPKCLIRVYAHIIDVNTTDFTVHDEYNNSKSSAEVDGAFFVEKAVVDLSRNKNLQFVLLFKRFSSKEVTDSIAWVRMVHPILKGSNNTFDLLTVGFEPSIFTFVAPIGLEPPRIGLALSYIKPGCTVPLFSGGEPSTDGAGKYLLFKYTEPLLGSTVFSPIRSLTATLIVNIHCKVTVTAYDLKDTADSYLSGISGHSAGFLMSYGYPGNVDHSAVPQKAINITHVVDYHVPRFNETYFDTDVVSFNPGNGENLLTVSFGSDDDHNFQHSVENKSLSATGSYMQVTYKAAAPDGAFLLRFESRTPGYVETTTRSAPLPFHFPAALLLLALWCLQ